MPDGGTLTIATALAGFDEHYRAQHPEVTPGNYVAISVTDDGEGMSEDIRDRVFEPFFTTKEIGKGSGLGLSMVYGFIKQSLGHVAVYSEPGLGTTVRLYLPVSEVSAAEAGNRVSTPPKCRKAPAPSFWSKTIYLSANMRSGF